MKSWVQIFAQNYEDSIKKSLASVSCVVFHMHLRFRRVQVCVLATEKRKDECLEPSVKCEISFEWQTKCRGITGAPPKGMVEHV